MNKPSFDQARATLPRVAAVSAPVLAALRGKKTYLGAALAALLVAYYLSVGNAEAAGTMAVLALGLAGLRGKLERIHAETPKSRHETRDTRHETGKPMPDRSLARDLARFEDEGGPPSRDPERTGPGTDRPTRAALGREQRDELPQADPDEALRWRLARDLEANPFWREIQAKDHARLAGEGFQTIPEARREAGLDRTPETGDS